MGKPALKKILVIKIRAMGDTILMSAPLLELTRVSPDSKIHVVVEDKWASLLEGQPGVERIWTLNRSNQKSRSFIGRLFEKLSRLGSEQKLTSLLKKENYDAVINFHASPSTARIAKKSGAQVRAIHFHGREMENEYSTVTIPGKRDIKSIVERDLDAVRALELGEIHAAAPKVFLGSDERRRAREILEHVGLKKPFLALGLGASRETKIWPMDRFAAVANDWVSRTGGSVLSFCSKAEHYLSSIFENNLSEQTRSHHHLFDTLTPRELACFFAESVVFVGNDSGPKHLCAAVGTPTITIFGPEDPFEWHPYRSDLHPYLFVENLPCRKDADPGFPPWCGLEKCLVENHRCMAEIPAEMVIEKVNALTS